MNHSPLQFVIPTYRLREVGETIREYDEHFFRNGHTPSLIVFDDSSTAMQQKYYSLLEQTDTHADLFYVGPKEKDAFVSYLNQRLRDRKLAPLVKNLFRPSYGGNRNVALLPPPIRQVELRAWTCTARGCERHAAAYRPMAPASKARSSATPKRNAPHAP
jgi:hypothetical protein